MHQRLMKAVGKSRLNIPKSVTKKVMALVSHAMQSPAVLIWLRNITLICVDLSDFELQRPNYRSLLEDAGQPATYLEDLMGSCLDCGQETHSVRACIVEELVARRLQESEKRTLLRQATFYECAGKSACGNADLDIFLGYGSYSAAQVSLDIDCDSLCTGYECKVTFRTWLCESSGRLDDRCLRKLDFMKCVKQKLPNSSLSFVSLEDETNCVKAEETLARHGYIGIPVLSILKICL
ncbi:MAG: hypothetical protein ACOX7L_09175 [Dethiobacteria bacterium]